MADNKASFNRRTIGPLYRLKQVLEIMHQGDEYTGSEIKDLEYFETAILPLIQKLVLINGAECDENLSRIFLHNSHIETDSIQIRYPNTNCILSSSNIDFLCDMLARISPESRSFSLIELRQIYKNIIIIIIGKILTGKDSQSRRIISQDILDCRVIPGENIIGYPDLKSVPGTTFLEKKAWLGGFDITEIPIFSKQKDRAKDIIEILNAQGLGSDLEHFNCTLLDAQQECRSTVCRDNSSNENPGPLILSKLRPLLGGIAKEFFPKNAYVDAVFCQGVLWIETDNCYAWWHKLNNDIREIAK